MVSPALDLSQVLIRERECVWFTDRNIFLFPCVPFRIIFWGGPKLLTDQDKCETLSYFAQTH